MTIGRVPFKFVANSNTNFIVEWKVYVCNIIITVFRYLFAKNYTNYKTKRHAVPNFALYTLCNVQFIQALFGNNCSCLSL